MANSLKTSLNTKGFGNNPSKFNSIEYTINPNELLNRLRQDEINIKKFSKKSGVKDQNRVMEEDIIDVQDDYDEYGELSSEYLSIIMKSLSTPLIPPPPPPPDDKVRKSPFLIYAKQTKSSVNLNRYILEEQTYRRLRFRKLLKLKYASDEHYIKIKMAKIVYIGGKYVLKLAISYYLAPMLLGLLTNAIVHSDIGLRLFSILLEQTTNYQFSTSMFQKLKRAHSEYKNLKKTKLHKLYFNFGREGNFIESLLSQKTIQLVAPGIGATPAEWKEFIFKFIINKNELNKKTPSVTGRMLEKLIELTPIQGSTTGDKSKYSPENILNGHFINFEDIKKQLVSKGEPTALFNTLKSKFTSATPLTSPPLCPQASLSYFIKETLSADDREMYKSFIALSKDIVSLRTLKIPGMAWSDITLKTIYELAGDETSDSSIFSAIKDNWWRDLNQSIKGIIYGNQFRIIIQTVEGKIIGPINEMGSVIKFIHDDVGINLGNVSTMLLDRIIDRYVNPFKKKKKNILKLKKKNYSKKE